MSTKALECLDDVKDYAVEHRLSLDKIKRVLEDTAGYAPKLRDELVAIGIETVVARTAYSWRKMPEAADNEQFRGQPKISAMPPKERGWMERYFILGAKGYRIAIGDATKEDLRAALRHARAEIGGLQQRVKFYSDILETMHNARKATDETCVRSVLTEHAFRRMAIAAGIEKETTDAA